MPKFAKSLNETHLDLWLTCGMGLILNYSQVSPPPQKILLPEQNKHFPKC